MGKLMHNGRFIGEWKWGHRNSLGNFGAAKAAMDLSLSLADQAREKRDVLTASGRFTPEGVREQLLEWLKGDAATSLREIRARIKFARDDHQKRWNGLVDHQIDKSDIAAALLRQEIRAHVRQMDDGTRIAMMKLPADLDDITRDAILEAPAQLSGLTHDQQRNFRNQVDFEARHAANPELAQGMMELDEAIGVAENAYRAAVKELTAVTDASEREIEELVA